VLAWQWDATRVTPTRDLVPLAQLDVRGPESSGVRKFCNVLDGPRYDVVARLRGLGSYVTAAVHRLLLQRFPPIRYGGRHCKPQ
jgi:hypothetical protein